MRQPTTRPGMLTLLDRKQTLDRLVIAGIAATFLSAAVPWFFQLIEVDVAAAAISAFILSAVYLVVSAIIDHFASARLVSFATRVSPFISAVLITVVWHFAGGIGNPVLLIVLSIPLLAAMLLRSKRLVFATAAAVSVAVAVATILEAPSLGWYLERSGLPVGGFMNRISSQPAGTLVDTPPGQLIAVLAAFTVAMFALAFLITRVADAVRTDSVRADGSIPDPDPPLIESAWHAGPIPMVVVTAETAQLVDASDSFYHQMLLPLHGKKGSELFDLIQFDEPQSIVTLLLEGGTLQFVRYRVGNEPRIASVHAETFKHHEMDYSSISIRDWDSIAYLAMAADTFDRPVMLIGEVDQRLRYANRAAEREFGEMYFGREMRWLTDPAIPHPLYEFKKTPMELKGSERAVVLTLVPKEKT